MDSVKKEASKYQVVYNGGDRYQVSGPWNDQCIVDVRARTCSCRRWELTGIPCKHAVATNWNMAQNGINEDPESWVHQSYRLSTWRDMYIFKIEPINGCMLWDKSNCMTTLVPPDHHTQVGRPKKKRRKTAEEMSQSQSQRRSGKLSRKGIKVTCDKCKQLGHNSRTCKGKEGASQPPV